MGISKEANTRERKMLRRSLVLGATLLMLGLEAGQAQIKVGVTIGMSGATASLGQPALKSIPTLPKEMGGLSVEYIVLDDESDPSKVGINVRKLISENDVDVLMGSSSTPTTLPMIDIAAENKTPLFAVGAGSILVTPMDDRKRWVFKVIPHDNIMAKVMIKYIAKTGAKNLAYLGLSDSFGEGYYNVLKDEAPKLGVTLTTHEVYSRSDASVTGQVLKVLATSPDAVFVSSAGTPAVLPQKALRERGYKGPAYHTHGVAIDEFLKLGGKDVEGVMFAGEAFTIAEDLPEDSPFKKTGVDYIRKYKEANGGAAPSILGAHLYDYMVLLERAVPNALKAGKPGTAEFRSAIRDEVERTSNVYVNNGLVNMTPTDHSGHDERSAFLIKVQDGRFRLLVQ
jgi:branched-chain amino acid transport system substrate-binding protein